MGTAIAIVAASLVLVVVGFAVGSMYERGTLHPRAANVIDKLLFRA